MGQNAKNLAPAATETPVPDAAPLMVSVPVPNNCKLLVPEFITTRQSPATLAGKATLSAAVATVVIRLIAAAKTVASA
jgi:hypothetical protein